MKILMRYGTIRQQWPDAVLVRCGMDRRMMVENDSKVVPLPQVGMLQRAVSIFLEVAYEGTSIPSEVLKRIAPINGLPPEAPAQRDWFEYSKTDGPNPSLKLRLGQRHYPHMKILLQPSPELDEYLFFADSHDRHLFTAVQSEAAALAAVRESNAQITREIEKRWELAGIPTFQSYLRRSMGESK
ncbi:MAG: hypothetical protein ACP5O1_09415 [Phycisphaerae bacterium]